MEDDIGIHDVAAAGFGSDAERYERARPDYPPEAVGWLLDQVGVSAVSRLLEVAAGTGKLTRLLRRSALVAVEPVSSMRSVLHAALPAVPIVAAAAEALPFTDGTFDAAVVAQAFHWFDGRRAIPEFRRVLKPGRALGLVWNVRDASVDWVARLWDIVDRYQGSAPRFRSGAWKEAFAATPAFGPMRERTFLNAQSLTPEGIVDRIASISYVATLPPLERNAVLDEVRRLLATHPDTVGRGAVLLPYRADVFVCRAL